MEENLVFLRPLGLRLGSQDGQFARKVPHNLSHDAVGAAYLAGLATGYWKSGTEIRENWVLGKSFMPDMPEDRRKELLKGWKRAVRCAKVYAMEED